MCLILKQPVEQCFISKLQHRGRAHGGAFKRMLVVMGAAKAAPVPSHNEVEASTPKHTGLSYPP